MKKIRLLKSTNNINNSKKLNVTQIVLTSCVIGTIIGGCLSMVNTFIQNAASKEIKQFEYYNELHKQRYEELRDALDFFSSFKLYDIADIEKIDVDSDLYFINEKRENSINKYLSNLYKLQPYLSDSALEILEDELDEIVNENGSILITDDFDPKLYCNDEELIARFKEHLKFANDQFEQLSQSILTAICNDLYEYTFVN